MALSKHIHSKDDLLMDAAVSLIGILVIVVTLYPLIFIVSASFSNPSNVINGDVILLPVNISLEGYKTIFNYSLIWTGYRNTVFYTFFGTVFSLILTIPAAFALSRKDLVGRNIVMVYFAITMFFSGGLIPTYLVVKNLGLVNAPAVMIILGAVSVWNLVIARTFFQGSIPMELQEAAYIDGSSTTRMFFTIVLPLAKPIVAVLALYVAVNQWNSYFNGLIYLNKTEYYPLQIFLRNILILDQMEDLIGDPDSVESLLEKMRLKESMKYGIVVLSSLPVLLMYPFLQKYFVKGMMVGAIKG